MDLLEYWLLNLSRKIYYDFRSLVYEGRLDAGPYGVPPFSIEEAGEALDRIHSTGLIALEEFGNGKRQATESELKCSDILCSIKNEQDSGKKFDSFRYLMTSKGGRKWEESSLANWGYYVYIDFQECQELVKDEIWELNRTMICMSKETLRSWIENQSFIAEDESEVIVIDRDSITWDTISNWKPTYWKTVPVAYSVQYKARLTKMALDPAKRAAAISWAENTIWNWYRDYYVYMTEGDYKQFVSVVR
jgi:hypothetical protein